MKTRPGDGAGVAVRELREGAFGSLRLALAAGRAGLENRVLQARVQRPGLALTGYTDYVRYGRVQIVGSSETGYLRKLAPRERRSVLAKLCRCRISCFVVTKGLRPSAELAAAAEARGIPLFTTPLATTQFIKQLQGLLEERLAARLHLHGVLLDVFGLGVLILGESGIGKSECALDLVDRGHRLVADDVVEVTRTGELLNGGSPELTRYHMELRGLGVLNVKDLYGVSSIRLVKRVELVIQLERWEPGKEYDRLGLRDERYTILGAALKLVRMPVAPGRNIALLVEVAARNQLLREGGYDAAKRFVERVDSLVAAGGRAPRAARRSRPPAASRRTRKGAVRRGRAAAGRGTRRRR
jgi:HPr kinase/phosphorylase